MVSMLCVSILGRNWLSENGCVMLRRRSGGIGGRLGGAAMTVSQRVSVLCWCRSVQLDPRQARQQRGSGGRECVCACRWWSGICQVVGW